MLHSFKIKCHNCGTVYDFTNTENESMEFKKIHCSCGNDVYPTPIKYNNQSVIQVKNDEVQVTDGNLWEGGNWIVVKNEKFNIGLNPPCKHCKPYNKDKYMCPYAIVVINEGGYNSTGLCLQCVLEHSEEIMNKLSKEEKSEKEKT